MNYVYTVHTGDGKTARIETPRPLRHWKSALMRRLPYTTSFIGSLWTREVVKP